MILIARPTLGYRDYYLITFKGDQFHYQVLEYKDDYYSKWPAYDMEIGSFQKFRENNNLSLETIIFDEELKDYFPNLKHLRGPYGS